jgi:Domain of unknown function (DUF4258)
MAEPTPMPLNDANALKLLRAIAADTGNVVFTDHVRRRMRERKVTAAQIIRCLRSGFVSESASLDAHGNWRLAVTARDAGHDITVAVAIDAPTRAIVITVF